MSGTISPARLLITLRILLSPTGGIKSREEVGRLVSLMVKFSRKLVSKVIYIHILRASTPQLLEIFLTENGWSLLISWFTTAVTSYNLPLCSELCQVFLLCPPPPSDRLPDKPSVLDLLQSLQSHHQPATLRTLASKILSSWTSVIPTPTDFTVILSKSPLPKTCSSSNLSSPLISTSTGPSTPQYSPMSLSRRCKRSVIVTNPLVVTHTSTPQNLAMAVTFQEMPLQEIVDMSNHQGRRETNAVVETQVWIRQVRRRIKEDVNKGKICPNVLDDENLNSHFGRLTRFSTNVSTPDSAQFEDRSTSVSKSSSILEDQVSVQTEDTSSKRPRRSVKVASGTPVKVFPDTEITQIMDLHDKFEDISVEEDTNPMKIFEDIADELKENLKLEKQFAHHQETRRFRNDVRSRDEKIWNPNNNESLIGFEGSAKDFRLARREKFREEQRLLEEDKDAQERRDREIHRERMKREKREEEKKIKGMKEVEEKSRKERNDLEEKRKREKMEFEFKKRREEERLKRKERERQERDLGSFKKSELKNGLNTEEKLKIKLIAQQMKESTALADSNDTLTSRSFQGKIPRLDKIPSSDQSDKCVHDKKPAKPLFSVAKNKNKDLLASLEDPVKPLKRPVAKDTQLVKKAMPPLPSSKLRMDCLEYGVKLPALGLAFQIPKKIDANQDEGQVEVKENKAKPEESIFVSLDKESVPDISSVEVSQEVKESTSKQDDKRKIKSKNEDKRSDRHPKKDQSHSKYKSSNKTDEKSKLKESEDASKLAKPKPTITLKPVSQLKECSVFGSLLEDMGNSKAKKRKASSVNAPNKKLKNVKMVSVKSKISPALESSERSVPEFSSLKPVAIVLRKVSGILIIERGSDQKQKSIKWHDDENLVQVEYFEVDASERVNVHKLKFEEIRQQELERERSLLTTRHNLAVKDGDDEQPWAGLKLLQDCGRSNFKPGGKSMERELQKMREARALPNICFGSVPLDPTEPDVSSNHSFSAMGSTRDILVEDVSGEGTEVDYSEEEWPEPSGGMDSVNEGIGTGQFYGGFQPCNENVELEQGFQYDLGKKRGGGAEHRLTNYPDARGFGRGAVASRGPPRGLRGGFVMRGRGRGGFVGKRPVNCKYWRRGNCRDGQNCMFLHL